MVNTAFTKQIYKPPPNPDILLRAAQHVAHWELGVGVSGGSRRRRGSAGGGAGRRRVRRFMYWTMEPILEYTQVLPTILTQL